MTTRSITFAGASGKTYQYFFLISLDASGIVDGGGNYAFLKELPNGNFVPLYFGIAQSLRQRLPNHEVWPAAKRLGATHVAGHTTPAGEKARLDEERDLIARWNPALNTQHRTAG